MSRVIRNSLPVSRNWLSMFLVIIFVLLPGIAGPGLAQEVVSNPLAPPDTSSPSATLKSFRENMEAAYREFYESPDVPVPSRTAAQYRGLRTLDESQLPPAEATRLAAEAAVLLNEVLDHAVLPAYDEIPDVEELRAIAGEGPIIYRIPGTYVIITEMESGPRKGEFLFSSGTINHLRLLYALTTGMTPQPQSMKGLYRLFSVAPGPMIYRAWIEQLPEWAKTTILDQAVWKWFATFLIIGLWAMALNSAHRYSRSRDGNHRYWQRFALALGGVGLTYFVQFLLEVQIILIGAVYAVASFSFFVIIYLLGAVAILNLGKAIAQTIIASRKIDPRKIDGHLISIAVSMVAWIAVLIFLTIGASRLGVPIEAVIGSLGVGGLAAALAARPTLENLIAGVTLYLDKPVRVGDFCQFEDVMGNVEEIGLRSTRIRQWDGNLISLPNSQFADFQLINYSDMKYILLRGNFGLRLDTGTDQLRFVLAKLREMLFAHPKVEWPRLTLVGLGESSLEIQLIAYVDTLDWGEYASVREDIYMRTLETIEGAGAQLAVPVRLTYLSRDGGTDEDLKTAAEKQVKVWREAGELPFPNMTAEQREDLQKTLDFPPKGSVDYEPKEITDEKKKSS